MARNNDLVDTEFLLKMFSENKEKAISQFIDFSNQVSDDAFIDYNKNKEDQVSNSYVTDLFTTTSNILIQKEFNSHNFKSSKDTKAKKEIVKEIKVSQ